MSDLSKLIRDEFRVEAEALRLGIRPQLALDKAKLMLLRAAEEIEQLEETNRKCMTCR